MLPRRFRKTAQEAQQRGMFPAQRKTHVRLA
jgi:hypothetical protein